MALPARRAAQAGPVAEGWDPARELGELHSRMEQLMENVWTGALADGGPWSPLVDVEETDDAWIVEAELPGVKSEDVDIELRDSQLSITGEIKERERKGILRRRTRRVGRFEYRITLPGDADADGIDASLDDGVLTVRIPKSERTQPRKIEVAAGHRG
jgi:HSP20 family protein